MTPSTLEQRQQEAERLRELWKHLLGNEAPPPQQFAYWLRYHTLDTVVAAIETTATKALRRPMDLDYKTRYVSRCANARTFELYERTKKSSCNTSRTSSDSDATKSTRSDAPLLVGS